MNPKESKAVKPAGSVQKEKGVAQKLIILFSMILIGVLLIVYKINYEYWAEQFVEYNQYLFGISIVCFILVLLIIAMDLKRIFKYEFIGTLFFGIGALIISLFYARVYFGLDGFGDEGTPFIIAGGVVMAIGTVLLMRNGGFIGATFVGIIIILLLSLVHMIDTRTLIQFDNNALQLINLTIVCFVISFFLLVYHDLKFFYLAKLMQDQRKYRKKKQYNEALKYCNRALLLYPYFATAWNNKGNVLVNMGKKKDAIKCYEKALLIKPDYIPARRNLQQVQ